LRTRGYGGKVDAVKETEKPATDLSDQRTGSGCAFSMLAVNAVLLGLLASSFSQGPYSSFGQEAWYRFGSIGFLLSGAVLPGIALLFGAKRSRGVTIALTIWMMVTLFACLGYALHSGGGV
jgi:hypothetical protein